ncbi:SpoIIE family protein phosphatase [Thermobifida halotolerans]|uniref:SpoIIE family protein phosphatase n=1 Tax=Thermobifida halotolerans TaxID=483545 RepID=A0AA97M3K0_9ACTN|nr:GAF domain-containing SpoIIE family protein phosphatase [Thermobifida halotolerans]UOE19067.1 SpoIIE family protein phosphatase [Thermobifida halotolerans]
MDNVSVSQTFNTVEDAALARARAGQAATAVGLDRVERLAFVAKLSGHLSEALRKAGTWRLGVEVVPGPVPRLRATVRPHGAGETETVWEVTADLRPDAQPRPVEGSGKRALVAEALLDADEDIAAVVELLREERERVEWHRDELEETNRGVLALHAELDAANETQRRLLEAEQAARTAAETARNRLTFLSSASAALTDSLNHEEVLRRLTELLVPGHARAAQVWLLDSRKRLDRVIGDRDAVPEAEARRAALAAVRTRRVQHVAARPSGLDTVDDMPPENEVEDRKSEPLLAIPMIARGAIVGVLLLAAVTRLRDDDVVMLTEVARRAAIAADNALRYERERDIAETLQRAMLTDLPTRKHLRLAARYLPATSGLNVGGDWYDVFPQPDGSLIGVIGDVTGHGIQAAVMMGQLRNALRAYAIEGHRPGGLLTRLHDFLRHLEPNLFASAITAQVRPGDPTVHWASAGHLPPLLRDPDGHVHVLEPKPNAMLGMPIDQVVTDHELTLAPGATLLLYTDGLVERRASGVDPGIEQLSGILARLGPLVARDPETAADAILDEMLHDYPGEDDVCLLLCHADTSVEWDHDTDRAFGELAA